MPTPANSPTTYRDNLAARLEDAREAMHWAWKDSAHAQHAILTERARALCAELWALDGVNQTPAEAVEEPTDYELAEELGVTIREDDYDDAEGTTGWHDDPQWDD